MFLSRRDPAEPDPGAGAGAGRGADRRRDWRADLALVRGVIGGEAAALESLVARLQCVPRFLAYLDGRAQQRLDEGLLEDVVQDVLATIWRRLDSFRGDAALETWVFRICEFQLRNAQRRATPRGIVSLEDTAEPAAPIAEPGADRELLALGIEALAADDAAVLRLKHYEGLTFAEIATKLRQSPNTVKTRYYRALESLRRWLRRPGEER
ncbi:MAG: RNA polymerase sigma factor [Planctomycetes bacterium]|nr:RNA polymerase sigma factor [Planctomycetota bacterium]